MKCTMYKNDQKVLFFNIASEANKMLRVLVKLDYFDKFKKLSSLALRLQCCKMRLFA